MKRLTILILIIFAMSCQKNKNLKSNDLENQNNLTKYNSVEQGKSYYINSNLYFLGDGTQGILCTAILTESIKKYSPNVKKLLIRKGTKFSVVKIHKEISPKWIEIFYECKFLNYSFKNQVYKLQFSFVEREIKEISN